MAIGYNTCVLFNNAGASQYTSPYTVNSEPNRILFYAGTGDILTVTYAGVLMTEIETECAAARNGRMFYLANPASGLNNFVATAVTTFPTRTIHGAMDFYGVDQINPLRDTDLVSPATTTGTSGVMLAEPSDVKVAFCCSATLNYGCHYFDTGVMDVVCCDTDGPASANANTDIALAYGPVTAGPTDTVVIDADLSPWCMHSAILRPYIPALGRAVKYYFNIWDPSARVRDETDRTVPPNEIEAETWLEVQGLVLPDPLAYDTFITDPTKARIVEVTATEKGATLRANRSQFADVLISRASAGRA
jgi:hypothetical protein